MIWRVVVLLLQKVIDPLHLIKVPHVERDQRQDRRQCNNHPQNTRRGVSVPGVLHGVWPHIQINRIFRNGSIVLKIDNGEDETDHGQTRG